MNRGAAWLRIGYALALAAALAWGALVLWTSWASGTLGFDYRAYDLAVDNLLAGRTMYDPAVQETGAFGLFFYPPPFALMVIPFALLPAEVGVLAFTALLIGASVVAIWLMPISARTKWIVALLAALSWPLLYAIKLGQVGPLLLLTFAAGWRWMDHPWRLGLSAALGTAIKLQPVLVIGWAAVTGRRRAAVIGAAAFAVIAGIATVIAGPRSWLEEADLLARVSKPVLTPHAFGVGRLLFEAGVPENVATAAHYLNLALVVLVTAFATLRVTHVASYLAVVVASQFVAPVLWDHYALLLLLPVAWLIERGRWLAALIPLATATPLLWLSLPGGPVVYPLVFWAALLGVTLQGYEDRQDETLRAQGNPAPDGIFAG